MGMDLIFVETVGAGQSEVEIATRAHTTVVVEMPLTGDVVQTMKAGILEIGDIYVVNKVDLGGADSLVANLKFQIQPRDGWTPPIVRTSALEDRGVQDLVAGIERHRSFLRSSGGLRRREEARAREEILESVRRLLADRARRVGSVGEALERLSASVAARTIDPQGAAERILRRATRPALTRPKVRRGRTS